MLNWRMFLLMQARQNDVYNNDQLDKMMLIIIIYLLAQVGTGIFLFFQYVQLSKFISHSLYAAVAILAYLLTHFANPGYANSEKQKLNQINHIESNSAIDPTLNQTESQTQKAATIIDTKFCRHCKEDQLLRMKHCYDCHLCVATFDHHCLWVDNCIGEKNRPYFYVCLLTNLIEIINVIVVLIHEMYQQGSWFPYQIAFLSIVGLIGSGVLVLTALHTYLMLKNLTTWETIRWDKIYYLLDLSKQNGSPFSRGWIGNLKDYWQSGFEKKFHQWNFNASALECLRKTVESQHSKEKG